MLDLPVEVPSSLAESNKAGVKKQAVDILSQLFLLPSAYAVAEFDYYRQFLVYPEDFPTYSFLKEILGKPNLPPEIFQFLQNGGDFFNGYVGAFGGKMIIDVFDFVLDKYTKRKIPERMKSAFAFISTVGVVSLVEAGLVGNWGTADLADIPAGALGALGFLGANYLARKLGEKIVNPRLPTIQPQIAK